MLLLKVFQCSFLLLVSQIYISFCMPTEKLYYEDVKLLSPEKRNLLNSWTEKSKQNIWEMSGQFEGDIILSSRQKNVIINTDFRWPKRVIPYAFDASFTLEQQAWITKSLMDFNNKTTIKTRPAIYADMDYVLITGNSPGCFSYVGRVGGQQILNLAVDKLGYGCLSHGVIIHEFLHALGFFHQQSSPERDDYVAILWDNIYYESQDNFGKYPSNLITNFNLTYDYASVMHYSATAFSKNGQKTIITTKDPDAIIGQRQGFSEIDIIKLDEMYKSSAHTNSRDLTSDLGLIFGLATIATIRFKFI